ncbi:MAG: hypothetical protein AABY85_08860, partial [Gemmatimonadota bacterium]
MRALRRVVGAAFLLFSAVPPFRLSAQTSASEPVRLTMQEAVRRALQYGEEVQLARSTVQLARGQVTEAFAGALPEIRGSV